MSHGSQKSQREVGSSLEPCPFRKAALLVTVQDGETNDPVEKVGIKLAGPSPGNKKSDPVGEADFKPIDPGSYTIELTLTEELSETYEEPKNSEKSVAAGGDEVIPVTLKRIKTWIEIELVGEDDKPIPRERYQITLPNGEVIKGVLDHRGRAREEGIEKGECQVTFPALDKDAWEFMQSIEGPAYTG